MGRSITDIERQTRAARPGSRTRPAHPRAAREHAAGAQQPPLRRRGRRPRGGRRVEWVIPTDVVPIFQAVLPNGKVLMWDSVGDGPAESYTDHTFTRAIVWDPATNTSVRRDVQGYNIFCAGYTQLADGRVLVAGGNKDSALNGIVQTHVFDWRTETWSRGPDMASGRWYPSVAALGNDEAADRRRRALRPGGLPDRRQPSSADERHRLRRSELPLPGSAPGRPGRAGRPARLDEHHRRQRHRGDHRRSQPRRHRARLRQLRDVRHRQGAGRRRRQPDRGRAEQRPDEDRGRGRCHRWDHREPDRLDVGRASPAQPDHPGRRQRPRDRWAEPFRRRVGRPRLPGVRGGAMGSRHRGLDRAGQREPGSGVPLQRGAAAGRPSADGRRWRLRHLRDQGVPREEHRVLRAAVPVPATTAAGSARLGR